MAGKNDTLFMVAAIIVAAVLLRQPAAVDNGGDDNDRGVDLCNLVESEVSLTGQRMFLAGTSLTSESARVIKTNGDGTIKDKGTVSLDSGTTDTKPKAVYNIYFGLNTTTPNTAYYVEPKDYDAPCDDATDDVVGVLCQPDKSLTITTFDEYGRPQSQGTNEQALVASDTKEVGIRVKVSADQCYGNPYSPMRNALCLRFATNSTTFKSVEMDEPTQVVPYLVSANNASAGYSINCYELKLLNDVDFQDFTVTIETADSYAYSDGNFSDIWVLTKDVGFDLDADTLEEIWGFEDEDNNQLGLNMSTAMIYVS